MANPNPTPKRKGQLQPVSDAAEQLNERPQIKDINLSLQGLNAVKGMDMQDAFAHIVADPVVQAAINVQLWSSHKIRGEEGNLATLVNVFHDKVQHIIESDNMDGCIELLAAQAFSLNAVSDKLLQRAALASNGQALELYTRLALKAQAQSRVSIEALATIKRPIFRQTNIANGPQQVNNHIGKEETEISLSTVGRDPPMETVASEHRTNNA